MPKVTRNVDARDLSDLFDESARATLAFERDGGIEAVPVVARLRDARYQVGVRAEDADALQPPVRVRLAVDDGCFWFDLRAVTVRGRIESTDCPSETDRGRLRWFDIRPEWVGAWDYGTLHEEETA